MCFEDYTLRLGVLQVVAQNIGDKIEPETGVRNSKPITTNEQPHPNMLKNPILQAAAVVVVALWKVEEDATSFAMRMERWDEKYCQEKIEEADDDPEGPQNGNENSEEKKNYMRLNGKSDSCKKTP